MGNPKISSMWAISFTDSTSNGKFNTFRSDNVSASKRKKQKICVCDFTFAVALRLHIISPTQAALHVGLFGHQLNFSIVLNVGDRINLRPRVSARPALN